ncbi:hypothetical protein C8R46DRAFT_1044802 [Mycena filopes]|nr:hypothetical protein C8R46DRAFT_1044802 [Mycena filopes]
MVTMRAGVHQDMGNFARCGEGRVLEQEGEEMVRDRHCPALDTDTRGPARKDAEHPHSVYHRAIGSRSRRRSDLALCNDRAKVVQSAHQIDLLRDPPRIKVVALQERFCTIQREQEGPQGS